MIVQTINPECYPGWTIIGKLENRSYTVKRTNDDRATLGVMKVYNLSMNGTKNYRKDLHFTEILGKAGVAPQLYYTKICNEKNAIMISEKFDTSLRALIDDHELTEDLKENLIPLITSKVKTMHDLNIAHGDLHPGNVLVNLNPLKVALIDFEYAFEIDTGEQNPEVQAWVSTGFDWEGTYEEFVDYDFTNWLNQMND